MALADNLFGWYNVDILVGRSDGIALSLGTGRPRESLTPVAPAISRFPAVRISFYKAITTLGAQHFVL